MYFVKTNMSTTLKNNALTCCNTKYLDSFFSYSPLRLKCCCSNPKSTNLFQPLNLYCTSWKPTCQLLFSRSPKFFLWQLVFVRRRCYCVTTVRHLQHDSIVATLFWVVNPYSDFFGVCEERSFPLRFIIMYQFIV